MRFDLPGGERPRPTLLRVLGASLMSVLAEPAWASAAVQAPQEAFGQNQIFFAVVLAAFAVAYGPGLIAESSRPPDLTQRAGSLQYIVNRGRRNFDAVFSQLASEHCGRGEDLEDVVFTYFDTFGGKEVTTGVRTLRQICLIERDVTNTYDDKRSLPALLQKVGCESAFARSYVSWEAAAASVADDPGALFFLKSCFETGGKNMQVLRRDQFPAEPLREDQILQRAVQDLTLVDGRKFVIRFYLLIHAGEILMHRRAAVFVHGVPYSRDSVEYDVQIRHNEVGAPFELGSTVRLCQLKSLHGGAVFHRAVARRLLEAMPVFQPLLEASSLERYTLIGGDALIESSGAARLIEFNMYPNLRIEGTRAEEFNTQVCQPVLRDVVCKILLGRRPPELEPIDAAAARRLDVESADVLEKV